MKKLELTEVVKYVETNIGIFHQKRIERLNSLELKDVLKRKNPYLFKAKNMMTSEGITSGACGCAYFVQRGDYFWGLVGRACYFY